ncbi:CTR copper uptake transporter [Epithele typhae]|uniref:CTR copper uptake transporter n=1 Tax=Epithele typhae TaxID=378194 RepID=UPI00200802F2|nr:CTR copper uptake transporter [Epithele typhae]KAH9926617.1 CTR copper uptake transporter [Epithele typhae]
MSSRLLPTTLFSGLLAATFIAKAAAHGGDDTNGMDMSMDGSMDLAAGNMLMWFHFTPGDVLWFYGWVPRSTGAMVGTCIGLFLLALIDRWIAACRGVMETHWHKRAQIVQADRINARNEKSAGGVARVRDMVSMRNGPPFIPANDLTRGVMHAAQSALHFAIMLALMTFQLAFFISIVIGLGVGEALFGRFGSHGGH